MRRAGVVQTISDLVGFAKVIAARIGPSKSTSVQIMAHDDDAGADACELWAHAPLLYRPLAGSEAFYVELGDERVVLATKERRYQIDVADGEVVVRAIGADSPAYVRLRPDGSCDVNASAINLGGAATDFVANATKVNAALTKLQTTFDTHIHASSGAGAPTVPLGTFTSVSTTKVKAE